MSKSVKILIAVLAVIILLVAGIFVFTEKKTEDKNNYEQNQEQDIGDNEEDKDVLGETKDETINDEENINISPDEKPDVDFMFEASKGEDNVTLPTFMYFISDADSDLKNINEVIEKLKKEYEGIVNFDIRNVTKEPENLKNFPVEGATPALIMLNSNNDITNILFRNSNYSELKQAIEEASK